jgi:ketosteroid isomerase-like protein
MDKLHLSCLGLGSASNWGNAQLEGGHVSSPAPPTDDELIRSLRSKSNAAIARHDARQAASFLVDDAQIIGSNGRLLTGAVAMQAAFESAFTDADFLTYCREPLAITVSDQAAAEVGRWQGRWKHRIVSGTYLTRWNRVMIGWRIAAELYVPL